MRIHLPPIPELLRVATWRVRDPHLSDLPDVAQPTLRTWTGAEPVRGLTAEGWPVWWVHANDCLWVIYELHVFVAIVHASNLAADHLAPALEVVLGASIDLASEEPISLADLVK